MVETVQMDMKEYIKHTSAGGSKPRNEYEHGAYLVESELKNEKGPWTEKQKTQMIINFSQVVDKHIQLANLGADKLLRLYQNDAGIMCDWLDMSIREEFIAHIFAPMYFSWRGEILMTHAKNGKMLRVQAAIGKQQNPQLDQGGFGAKELYEEEDANILQRILGKKKRDE